MAEGKADLQTQIDALTTLVTELQQGMLVHLRDVHGAQNTIMENQNTAWIRHLANQHGIVVVPSEV